MICECQIFAAWKGKKYRDQKIINWIILHVHLANMCSWRFGNNLSNVKFSRHQKHKWPWFRNYQWTDFACAFGDLVLIWQITEFYDLKRKKLSWSKTYQLGDFEYAFGECGIFTAERGTKWSWSLHYHAQTSTNTIHSSLVEGCIINKVHLHLGMEVMNDFFGDISHQEAPAEFILISLKEYLNIVYLQWIWLR